MKKIHKNVLSSKALETLINIQSQEAFRKFYLVEGTALALQIGHRKSKDFDLFSQQEFKSSIANSIDERYKVISLHDNSIELDIKGNKFFFFYFAFPLYKDILTVEGIKMAHPIDIGLMKLLSLQGRTVKKDIIDLYFIDKEIIKLEKLLKIFEKHYPKESFNSYKSFKSLINPQDLKKQPMPVMLKKFGWEKALKYIKLKIAEHIKMLIK